MSRFFFDPPPAGRTRRRKPPTSQTAAQQAPDRPERQSGLGINPAAGFSAGLKDDPRKTAAAAMPRAERPDPETAKLLDARRTAARAGLSGGTPGTGKPPTPTQPKSPSASRQKPPGPTGIDPAAGLRQPAPKPAAVKPGGVQKRPAQSGSPAPQASTPQAPAQQAPDQQAPAQHTFAAAAEVDRVMKGLMGDSRHWTPGPEQGPYKDAIQQIWALAHPGTQTLDATGRPIRPTHVAVPLDTLKAEAARLLPRQPDVSAGHPLLQHAAIGESKAPVEARSGIETQDDNSRQAPESQLAQAPDFPNPSQWLFEQAGRQIYGAFGGDPNAEQPVHVGDPIDADGWEDWSRQALTGAGLPEEVAEVGVILVSASPAGTGADIAQGLYRFGDSLAEADVEGALAHLAEAGLDAVKIGKVERALGAMTDRGMQQLAETIDDPVSVYLMRDLAKQGLTGDSVRDAIKRGLKNGFDPGDAVVYGVFSAHAGNALGTAAKGVLGKGATLSKAALAKLAPDKRAQLEAAFASELAAIAGEYVQDISDEVTGRMIAIVSREIFGEPDRDDPSDD